MRSQIWFSVFFSRCIVGGLCDEKCEPWEREAERTARCVCREQWDAGAEGKIVRVRMHGHQWEGGGHAFGLMD